MSVCVCVFFYYYLVFVSFKRHHHQPPRDLSSTRFALRSHHGETKLSTYLIPFTMGTRVFPNWTNGPVFCAGRWGGGGGVLTFWECAGPARSLDCCLKSSKTVEMFPLPQSPAGFTLISYESRPRESVTFPVTLGCLQPIGRQQIYFYLSGPIAWQCGSAHCLVTVTNMLIRESQMMDGSSPESGPSF